MHGTDSEWMFTHEAPIVIGLILSMFIVPKIANAFFFKMTQSIRIESTK